ncbi:IclR family transcriptional regulator [Streptomyces sp. N2-109]|uniref:IclR family transcriptional regulator n=1 Tax=Streptomyces gossypii TaxID=2883101 RepID=A0ABT2K271_9ACTN|nr:IclR family transcriptional regulator [Streptomyces gossypii]MCT2593559.1 IclR family transcriptional regulator [Streptomyces gossypii]
MTTPVRSSGLHRTLAILTALGADEAAERGGLGVVEIARRVGREKTQVSRALKALDQAGLVQRDPDTLVYRLGWRVFTIATNAGHQRLLAEAPPVLRRLVHVLKERVHLTVLTADGALTVLSESPMRTVQAAGWVGRLTPLHTTSSGRALLLDHQDEEIRDLFADTAFGTSGSRTPPPPRAPRDLADFLDRLHGDQERGYALVREEFEVGLVGAAAPVRDFRGRVTAALNVSGPRYRMGRELDRAGRVVCSAAHQLSRAMAGN